MKKAAVFLARTCLLSWPVAFWGSVLSAAITHGALNGTAMAPDVLLKGGDPLRVGVMGFAGMLVLVCLNAALLCLFRPAEWHNRWIERTRGRAAHAER